MDYLSHAILAAKKAGEILLTYFHGGFSHSISIKSDQSPVTQADLVANKIICEQLNQFDPSIPIISEELNIPDFFERQQLTRYWLIDPLDGTRGFIRRSPEFCVNIALIENHVPIIGVIYSPVEQACYYAEKNSGAYFLDANNNVTQLLLSKNKTGVTRFLTGRFDNALQINERKRNLEKTFGSVTVTQMNSALKFGLLARGMADVYVRFGSTSEWDSAAGQCILEVTGGAVVDFQGRALQYNAKSSLINPSFVAMSDAAWCEKYIDSLQRIL